MTKDKGLFGSVVVAFSGQFFYIVIGLLGNVFLARLLSPKEFGQVAIVMVFVSVSNILVESGFGGALIRREKLYEDDFSTIFIFNFLVSILLSLGIFFGAPFIGQFYSDSSLINILRLLSVIPILNSFQITANAKLVHEMRFKSRAKFKLYSLIVGTVIAIFLAYKKFGAYSLVSLYLGTSLTLSLIYFFKERAFSKLIFNRNSFKEMYSFGVNTASTNILNSIFNNAYQLILGKYFNINSVGLYYQAKRLQDVSDTLYNIVLSNVFFSHLAKLQNHKEKFQIEYKKIVIFIACILSVSISLVFLYSKEIILILFGKDWIASSFFLKVLCVSSMFYLQELVNRNIFKVFDKTRVILYLEILKKLFQVITIGIGVYFLSIELLLYGFLVTSVFSYIINYFFAKKIIDAMGRFEIIFIGKIILLSSFSVCATIVLINYFNLDGFYRLFSLPFFFIFHFFILWKFKIIDTFKKYRI